MHRYWGYSSALTVALIFGVWYSFDKILLQYLHPLALAGLTYVVAALFLFLIRFSPLQSRILTILNRESEVESFISRRDYALIFITALLGSVVAPAIYLTGLNQITAVNAALLMNVQAFFIIVIGIFFLKESVQKKDIFGFIFLLSGAIFLTTGNGGNLSLNPSLYGSMLVILAALFWSMDTSLSKFLSNKRDLVLIAALKCSIGGVFLILISLILGLNLKLPLNHLPYLIFIGLFCISFSLVLTYFSIREIGSTRTGSIFAFDSLFGAIFAFIILNEPFTVLQLLFGLLMLVGVFILYRN
jgi:drug/metabolite transporter (DMT)-like permease